MRLSVSLNLNTERIAALYFWGFVLLRPILYTFKEVSFFILLCFAVSLFVMDVYLDNKVSLPKNILFILGLVFSVLCFDILFRRNGLTFFYFYNFLIYGLLPMYFVSKIENVKVFLRCYSNLAIIGFFSLSFNGILADFGFFANYMDYGFGLMMPAFYGIFLGRKLFHKKWLVWELICAGMILMFANRGSLFAILLFYLVMHLYFINGKRKTLLFLTSVVGFFLIVITYGERIALGLRAVLANYGLQSYSLVKISKFLGGNKNSRFLSGRGEIWSDAKELIHENPIFGQGTGVFESIYGIYPHNLFYDVLTQYGYIGLLLLLVSLTFSIRTILRSDGLLKLFGILIFCLFIPKLLLSGRFYSDMSFWTFVILPFIPLYSRKFKQTIHLIKDEK